MRAWAKASLFVSLVSFFMLISFSLKLRSLLSRNCFSCDGLTGMTDLADVALT
jgi:hypothetical protein